VFTWVWACSKAVCSCARVRSPAGADGVLIRGMCASAARSLRKAIHRWNTHIHSISLYRLCMHVSISMRVWLHRRTALDRRCGPVAHAPTCCVRECACAIGRPRIRADACERLPSASTAGGSARRRSSRRRRLTRTSARGTPRVSPTCPRYAPPPRPGRRAEKAGLCSAMFDATRAVVCGRRRRCALACVCADARVYAQMRGLAHARASTCVGIATRTQYGIHICIYVCV
jgi:hypothetical protein